MRIRTHVGVSLDGFIAGEDGAPAWDYLPSFTGDSHGIPELSAECQAVAMGRTSFDQGISAWKKQWPYSGKKVYVLSSKPLPDDLPGGVVVVSGGIEALVEQLRSAEFAGDVHLLGGARIIQGFIERGAVDELGICVLPLLMGKGIPLFDLALASYSTERWAARAEDASATPERTLRLVRQNAFPDGAIDLIYVPQRQIDPVTRNR